MASNRSNVHAISLSKTALLVAKQSVDSRLFLAVDPSGLHIEELWYPTRFWRWPHRMVALPRKQPFANSSESEASGRRIIASRKKLRAIMGAASPLYNF
jgi:hypothetical protein